MPPLVAVKGGSSAYFSDNTLHGGGVAGVLVQGTAHFVGNRFEGNGPRAGGPPNFAVWGQQGAEIDFSNNTVNRWRHAIQSSAAQGVVARNNSVGHFLKTAFVISKPSRPAHVFGNTAYTDNKADQVVAIDGPSGIVAENLLEPLSEFENGKQQAQPDMPATGAQTSLVPPQRTASGQLLAKVKANLHDVLIAAKIDAQTRNRAEDFVKTSQWDAVQEHLQTTRKAEMQEHAHALVEKELPTIIQGFMPDYMRSKIMAQRAGRKAGPPSKAAINSVRQEAMAKRRPEMREIVMPALDKLATERVVELTQDDKVMTRLFADQLIRSNLLGAKESAAFSIELERAGYSPSLATGGDAQLEERTREMLKGLDLKAASERAGL